MGLLANQWATPLFLLGMVILILSVRRATRRGLRRSASASTDPRPKTAVDPATAKVLLDVPAQLTRWEVRMHDLTRDFSGRLDTKITILDAMLREAAEKIAQLEETLSRVDRAVSRLAAMQDIADEAGNNLRPFAEGLPPRVASRDMADGAEGFSAKGPERENPYAPRPRPDDPRWREIYALAAEGQSSALIAQRVGCPIGEVELILSLRSEKSAT